MSTFGELQPIVSYNLQGRNDPDTIQQIMFSMNFVQKILAASHEWKELQKTAAPVLVSGTNAYTDAQLSLVNPQRIYQIMLNDGTRFRPPMIQTSEQEWRAKYAPGVVSTGIPSVFSRFAGYTHFAATPNGNYTLNVEYFQKVGKLTGVNSVISFEDIDELIIALTTAVTWLACGEESLFQKWLAFATPLIEDFNLDSNRIMNFISPGNRHKATSAAWLDPFARRG